MAYLNSLSDSLPRLVDKGIQLFQIHHPVMAGDFVSLKVCFETDNHFPRSNHKFCAIDYFSNHILSNRSALNSLPISRSC